MSKVAVDKNVDVQGIEIANPLYDVVFKHLMENTRVASYFIETFIGEKVENLTLLAQESTYFKWLETYDKLELEPEDLELLKKITVIRLDFVATIKTEDGELNTIIDKEKKIRKQAKTIEAKDKTLKAKDKTLKAKDKALTKANAKIKELEELLKHRNS